MATLVDFELSDDGDIVIEDGDLQIVSGRDAIAQRLRVKLRHHRGEWFLNTDFGVPYIPAGDGEASVLGKGTPPEEIEAILKDQILSTPGVGALRAFSFSIDRARRSASLSFRVTTDLGEVEVEDLELEV